MKIEREVKRFACLTLASREERGLSMHMFSCIYMKPLRRLYTVWPPSL